MSIFILPRLAVLRLPNAELAYLRLIREVHPDRLANAPSYWQRQAEEKSKEINEAFAVLSNSAKRRSYDAQLDAYRGSQSTTSRQTTSQASTPSPASSTQQQSQTSSRSQYSSGASTSSAQTPRSSSQQHQAASTSATPPNVPSRSSSQPVASRMNAGQRFFFALLGSIFAFGAASAFWASSSIGNGAFTFFLATVLLFGVACLYQRQMSRIFLALRVSQPKQQLWVTIGIVVLVLLVGKTANMNRDTHFRGPDDHPAASSQISQVTSDAHYREQPSLGSGQQIVAKSEPEKITHSQPFPQTARQPSPQENTQQPIPAAAPIAGSSGTDGKATQEDAEAPWRKSLSGSWVGKYNCAQGVTGLTLTIAETAGGGLSGIFDFYPVPEGNRFPEGSYSGAVTAGPDGSFEFKPQRWISQPPGFIPVALSGHYVADAQRLQGQVTGAIGCTSFDLSRQRSQARPPSVTYDLSSLSASDRDSIESACSGARLVQGAASYHRCLNTQLEELAQHPDAPDLSRLSSVDRASIESACSGTRLVQGAASYHRCLNTQLEELAQHPDAPDLSRLSSADRASIESACSGTRLVQGAASYHRCLNTQLEELARYPDTPDLSGLSSVDRNSIESACSGARLVQGAAAYHRCLRNQLSELGAR